MGLSVCISVCVRVYVCVCVGFEELSRRADERERVSVCA